MRGSPFGQLMNMFGGQGGPGGGGMNPMQMMQGGKNPMQMMQGGNPLMNMMGGQQGKTTKKPVDPTQFKQYVNMINPDILTQLEDRARSQGISEEEIEKGMNFVRKMMKK